MVNNMDFVLKRIGDLCSSSCSGGTPKSTEPLYYEGGTIPWLTTGEVNFKDIYDTENKITELGLKKSSAKFIPINSVIVAMYGVTAGKSAINKIPLTTNQACCNLQINEKIANYRFVYYYLMMQSDQLNKLANGGAQQNLNSIIIKKFKINVPNLDNQNRIANLLNKYDSLIGNNNKRIELLGKTQEELFKEWFIRFRYPGSNFVNKKDSELGKIPETFNILKAGEIFDYYIGGGWGNDDYSDDFPVDAYVIRGTDFPFVSRGDVSTCPYRYHKVSNYNPRELKGNDIILEISGGTAEQPVGRAVLVSDAVLSQLDNKVICASFCKLIRPDYTKVTPGYLVSWLKYLYDSRMIERFQLQSTGIINFQFEYFLKKGPILVAPLSLMNKFEEITKPMRDEIDKLALENVLLIKQRDSLLPRLMSGKLSVEGKEIV